MLLDEKHNIQIIFSSYLQENHFDIMILNIFQQIVITILITRTCKVRYEYQFSTSSGNYAIGTEILKPYFQT